MNHRTALLSDELPADARSLRVGSRWVPDTVVPLVLCDALRAALQVYADEVRDKYPRGSKRRRDALSEASCRRWLASRRSSAVTAAQQGADAAWLDVFGDGTRCPIEVVSFPANITAKDRPDDLAVRYRIGGRELLMWANHKRVGTTSDSYGRIGSIRAVVAAAAGRVIPHWSELVAEFHAAGADTGRPQAALVAALVDSGDTITVRCYEPSTVYAFGHLVPDEGVHPRKWVLSEARWAAKTHAKENALVQACHAQSERSYRAIARALVAQGVNSAECSQVAFPMMLAETEEQLLQAAGEIRSYQVALVARGATAFTVAPRRGETAEPVRTGGGVGLVAGGRWLAGTLTRMVCTPGPVTSRCAA